MNVASAKGTLRRASLFPNETVAGAFFCPLAFRVYVCLQVVNIAVAPFWQHLLLCGDKTRFGDMQYFWPRRYIK